MTRESIPFTELVQSLPATVPFVGPESIERERGRIFKARIGANESAFGISPKAAAAMRNAVEKISWYGDPENHDLRSALAELHGVTMEEICVAGGIDELLGLLVRMTVTPGMPVVTSHGAYPTFNYHVAGFGGRLETVPYRADHEDPEALLAATKRHKAPLIYLANPDNPMGTWHGAETVGAFIGEVPADSLLLLDEAYIEFSPEPIAPPIDTADHRVVRLRTFSKAHGMAGGRIGYAVAHRDVITGLNKIRNHFGMNRVAQAGALASLGDPGFIDAVRHKVEAGRQDYYTLAKRLGFTAIPSATNFVAIDVGSGERARAILQGLLGEDVFIRMPGVAPLDRCVRVTVGTPEDRAVFAKAFETVAADTSAVQATG